jgi:hypothetical protein
MRINRDTSCGLLFIVIGLAFGCQAIFGLEIGRLRSMGPGFFPAFLSAAVIVIGIVVAVSGLRQETDVRLSSLPWRSLIAVLGGPIVFGVMIEPLGLVPSLLILALVASIASRKTTLKSAISVSAIMVIICVAIFYYGLGVPIPLFGPLIAKP